MGASDLLGHGTDENILRWEGRGKRRGRSVEGSLPCSGARQRPDVKTYLNDVSRWEMISVGTLCAGASSDHSCQPEA